MQRSCCDSAKPGAGNMDPGYPRPGNLHFFPPGVADKGEGYDGSLPHALWYPNCSGLFTKGLRWRRTSSAHAKMVL